jgi:hypothetical protein
VKTPVNTVDTLSTLKSKRVLAEISAMAGVDATDFLSSDDPLRALPENARRAIAGIRPTKYGHEIKLSKFSALEALAHHHGLIKSNQVIVPTVNLNMSDAQISRMEDILASMPDGNYVANGDDSASGPVIDVTAASASDVMSTSADAAGQDDQILAGRNGQTWRDNARRKREKAQAERAQKRQTQAEQEAPKRETQAQRESRLNRSRCQHPTGMYCSLCVMDYATGAYEERQRQASDVQSSAKPAAKPVAVAEDDVGTEGATHPRRRRGWWRFWSSR